MTAMQEHLERRNELFERRALLQEFLDFCAPEYKARYRVMLEETDKAINELHAVMEQLNHNDAMEAAFGPHGQG